MVRFRIATVLLLSSRVLPSFLALAALGVTAALPVHGQGSAKKNRDSGKLAIDPAKGSAQPAEVELPNAVTADAARLTFQVSRLSSKGLLLEQTRDALRAIMDSNHGGRIVKLRAFVAGTGDARRIRQIVTDMFQEKKKPLPALTTVFAGELPMDGAQVVLESVTEQSGAKPVNPDGVVFLSSKPASGAKSAIDQLSAEASSAGVEPKDVLRVTCFLASVADAGEASLAAARVFPSAVFNPVQALRAPAGSAAACEGVGRGKGTGAAKLVFTGAQMAFGSREADLKLAMDRLQKSLEPLGASFDDVVFAGYYPVSRSAEQMLPSLAAAFFRGAIPSTTEIFEGLPSPDASLSVEVVAAIRN